VSGGVQPPAVSKAVGEAKIPRGAPGGVPVMDLGTPHGIREVPGWLTAAAGLGGVGHQ